jgi:hypothetical protein
MKLHRYAALSKFYSEGLRRALPVQYILGQPELNRWQPDTELADQAFLIERSACSNYGVHVWFVGNGSFVANSGIDNLPSVQ